MNEERWLNPDDPVVVGVCPVCFGEIYKGEQVYNVDGEKIHEECLLEWAQARYEKEVAE